MKDGRVHCSININTETGRLSARRPSLQVLCELSFVASLIQMLDCTYVLEDKSIIVINTRFRDCRCLFVGRVLRVSCKYIVYGAHSECVT